MKSRRLFGLLVLIASVYFAPQRLLFSQQKGEIAKVEVHPTAAPRKESRTFFAFEHDLWDGVVGADLQLQPMTKYAGNPVIPRGPSGAPDSGRVSYTSLIPDGGRLRAWYGAMGENDRAYAGIAYAESEDGIHWTKPDLQLAAPGTNLLIGREAQAALLTVVPDDTAGRKAYRGVILFLRPTADGSGKGAGSTFQVVTSADGLHWNFTKTPATDIQSTEEYGMYRHNGEWWVLGQGVSPYFSLPDGRPHRRVMYGYHSPDATKWKVFPLPLFMYPFDPDFPDSMLQEHMGAAVWDRGRIVLGFQGQLHPGSFSESVGMTLGLIYTRDGMKWTEPFPQTPIIMPGPKGAWDNGWLLQTQRPVSRGKSTYFYYSGSDGGNTIDTHFALGLATLRRDGFAAFTANKDDAMLVTEPLDRASAETTLYLNASGRVAVQILDQYLEPIAPEKTIDADDVQIPAYDLRGFRIPAKFRVAFRLSKGTKLYTFALGPVKSQLPPLDTWE